MKNKMQQQGFTLVEILVTIVIFAFGMLGVAGLQLVSLTGMDTAQYRSYATLKASDMADRMRANPTTVYAGVAGTVSDCRPSYYNKVVAAPAACDSGKLAADEVADWTAELAKRLPEGKGVICMDSTPDDGIPTAPACDGGGTIAIKVWWTDKPRSKVAAVPKRVVVSMVP
ncbi:MAG TPA: type IV pilus modification protein PilV [Telluria sp.]|jgi:type IV pilus assembly protein PilV|nr:type IV pilus modification protein PilV [Telluria sp.]